MSLVRFLVSAALAAQFAPAAAQPTRSTQAAPAEARWVGFVSITRLRDEFAERPARATLRGQHEQAWGEFDRPVELPASYRFRSFVAESFVLLDVDPAGRAAGCRPLRAGREPQLDAFACTLLMRPGFFAAALLPPRESVAGRWVMGLRWESLPAAAHRAREANAVRPVITTAPLPPPAAAPPRAQPAPPQTPSEGPRRASSGSLDATDYRGVADRRITEGHFEAELAVNEQGVPTACRVTKSSGNAAVDERTCALLVERARFTLRVDASGRLIADTVTQPVDVGWMLHGWRRPVTPPRPSAR